MWLSNKRILITGGTGTIGKALLKRLLSYDINHIYIFSRDEQKQDSELHEFRSNDKVSFIIGDIRDINSVNSALMGVDIVFHTAAMKIVGICENNPYEAFLTNVIGTENIIRGANANKVKKVIFTSSDKAANPTTVMGVGKLYAERLISQANFIKGNETVFSSIRFGNVFGSRGCVLDLFKSQIKNQDYITVTHPNMTRFISTVEEAVNILITGSEISQGGEIFVKKMPSIKIIDFAEALIEYLSPIYNKETGRVKIKITEKQQSEKLYEELVTLHEAERTLEFDDYYCILPTLVGGRAKLFEHTKGKFMKNEVSSQSEVYLSKEEILQFLIKSSLV